MKHSVKTLPPLEFSEWLNLANEEWTPSYENLSGPPRIALFNALLYEQAFVCAYCGRRIKLDETSAHIDHFWPQSDFGPGSADDKSLDYNNLYLSCGPNKFPHGHTARFPVTCGDAKGNRYDTVHFVMPADPHCETNFRFGILGTISPNPATNLAAARMIEFLNLAEPSLQQERSVLLLGIEQDIVSGEISIENREDIMEIWRLRDEAGCYKSLAHVVYRYIADEII